MKIYRDNDVTVWYAPAVMSTRLIQIGEVASQSDTTIRTVRYYLQEGLIREAERSQGGFYLFAQDVVEKVRYICLLREMGLSLPEIKLLIQIRRGSDSGGVASQRLRDRLDEQLGLTEKRIEAFQKLKREISETIKVLEGCEGCKARPVKSVCGKCSVMKDADKLPAPMKAIY